MSIIDLPVQKGDPEEGFSSQFSYTIILEGRRHGLRFYTNGIDGLWYFDLTDTNFDPVVVGLGLSVGVDLLFPYRHLSDLVPPGVLYCVDLSGVGSDPTTDSFLETGTHLVRYMTSDQAFPTA